MISYQYVFYDENKFIACVLFFLTPLRTEGRDGDSTEG